MNIMVEKFSHEPGIGLHNGLQFVCWSRMQAEAGQALDDIVRRKELERQAGDGVFFWGVGNPPARLTSVLAKTHHPVSAIFSIMKSKPKSSDVAPGRTVIWQTYIDRDGLKRDVPRHVLVTSRGDTNKGSKRSHYALICFSEAPLVIERGCPFDPKAYRNTGELGKPIGASQVTALLQPVRRESNASAYEVNLRAKLHDSYWVRLEDPAELDVSLMPDALGAVDSVEWLKAIRIMKARANQIGQNPKPQLSQQLDLLKQAS